MTTVPRSDLDLFRRSSAAATAACIAALAGVGGGLLANDTGTRVMLRADLRALAGGTRLESYETTNGTVRPFVQPTRTERILSLTGLSQRQLAAVLGVSHTLVGNWTQSEPNRDELTEILGVIEHARRYHPDLKRWLLAPVPGTDITPVTLLKARNWRALQGAIRAKAAPPPSLSSEALLARRQREVSWALAESAIPLIDE
ncbi:MAG: hypothetical protein ACLP8S_00335 [Solirubrobacteraceae bacterium]